MEYVPLFVAFANIAIVKKARNKRKWKQSNPAAENFSLQFCAADKPKAPKTNPRSRAMIQHPIKKSDGVSGPQLIHARAMQICTIIATPEMVHRVRALVLDKVRRRNQSISAKFGF